jgi:O-methyltransferase
VDYYKVYGCGRVEETRERFMDVERQILHRTLLTPDRLWILWAMARYTLPLGGCIAECGTYLGGASKVMYLASDGTKPLHIFDTFTGIPAQYIMEGNGCRGGEFAVSQEQVRATLGDIPATLYQGLVPETLSQLADEKFSLVHLDMDVYLPTLEASKFFWPRLVDGGVIVYDDWATIEPITKAVTEFAESVGVAITTTAMMQCVIQKEAE